MTNLAPISDTTISSALTQEADISSVVRTQLPYRTISGAVAAVLCGDAQLQDANIPADLELDGGLPSPWSCWRSLSSWFPHA